MHGAICTSINNLKALCVMLQYTPSPIGLPGPTPFTVVAESTTSLLVTWSPPKPTSIHPLLLRYEIITTHTLTNITFTSGPLLPSSTPWVVEGLNVSSTYLVRVSSWGPLGRGAYGQELTASTYGSGEYTRSVCFSCCLGLSATAPMWHETCCPFSQCLTLSQEFVVRSKNIPNEKHFTVHNPRCLFIML